MEAQPEINVKIPLLVESYTLWTGILIGSAKPKDIPEPKMVDALRFAKKNNIVPTPITFPMAQFLLDSEEDICPVCNGYGVLSNDEYYCICHLQNMLKNIKERMDGYQSHGNFYKSLDDLVYWGSKEENASLSYAVNSVRDWITNPHKWIVLCGTTGCGKTHLMRYIYSKLMPLCLYMVAADFESLIFRGLDNNDLDRRLEVVKMAPILLLDDYGIEYGSDIVKAKIDHVIETRYRNWRQYKTVVATNLTPVELKASNSRNGSLSRSGSRLCDPEISTVFGIQIRDYRLKGDTKVIKV